MEKQEKNTDNLTKIGTIVLIIGIILTFTIMIVYPAETKGEGILTLIGVLISTIGIYIIVKKYDRNKIFLYTYGFLAVFLVLVIIIDFVDVEKNDRPPRFTKSIETYEDIIVYKTPFYDVYRINPRTQNEYYIVDQKGEYTKDTIPVSEFNRVKSGIDKIINYKYQYVGDNTNDGNLIAHLPLSEYGYTFEIDSTNYGLIINYQTDYKNNDELYMKKSLIYNTVSIYALIENVQYVKFNFNDRSYTTQRNKIEETYPNYTEIINNKSLNKDNFNKYVEDKMKDDEFVLNTFKSIFE